MAEKIISPGVFTRENDLSFLTQGVGEIGAAIIGPFKEGPAFLPTIVNTQSEFEEIFGTPDGTYYSGYTVQNYLREAGTVTVVKVGGVGGYEHAAPFGVFATGSDGSTVKLIATLHATVNGDETTGFSDVTLTSDVSSSDFVLDGAITGSGTDISSSINPAAANDVSDVFGESALGTKDGYTYKYFENEATSQNGTLVGLAGQVLPTQDFTYDTTRATTPWIQSQLISSERYNLFRFHTIGHGNVYNTKYKIIVFNVKAAGENNSTDFATFSVAIRRFDDTDRRPVVLETFNNLTLDPVSPNYIARVIGDRYLTIDSSGKITENGDYVNNSKYIYIETVAEGAFPVSAAPFAHGAYTNPITLASGEETKVPAVIFTSGSSGNDSSDTITYSGIDLETTLVKIDNSAYLAPIPDGALTGSNVAFGFDSTLSFEMTGSDADDIAKRQFVVAFQSGFDGKSPAVTIDKGTDISAGNSQGFDLSSSTSSGSVAYVKAINAVSNPDEWDINLVATPGVVRRLHSYVTTKVIDMVEARADAFYIADFVGANDTIQQVITQANAVDSSYAGTYYPWIKTVDVNTNRLVTVPPSVLLPAVFAANDRIGAEWFAPAGLNRGGLISAVSVLNRLTHSERDQLYDNKVNPIASFPGQGISAWGQKTLQDRASALDRINVRRLLITTKKFIASSSRFLIFEQNTATTRSRFLNIANPYFEDIQQRQGLYAFRVVMDETNNTPDVIDRNILAGAIYLQPTKTSEFVIIDFNVLPTGAQFS